MSALFPKPTPKVRTRKPLKASVHIIPWRTRHEVILRDEMCRWCEVPGGALDCHHRLPRSRGGKDDLRTLVAVHRFCHRFIHEHPTPAMERGFTVRSDDDLLWDAQPVEP